MQNFNRNKLLHFYAQEFGMCHNGCILILSKDLKMTESKQSKPSKRESIENQIDALIAENRRLIARFEQMREASAKLCATIAKSKKLIADWEC